jgi:predicted phage terminase large subunit-like protein
MQEQETIQEIAKLSLAEWESLFESVEKQDEKLEILRLRCATDLELFSSVFFPHYCSREFNPFHRDMFGAFHYRERDVRRVRAAPRGSAKSTLAALIKPIHDVCYGLETFVLILSSTTPLANKKLKDIRSEILSNNYLRAVFGVRFPVSKPGKSEFTVYSHAGRTHFMALGRGSEVRGVRDGESRPSKVIADDVEHSDEIYNEETRAKTETWFFEDIGKVGDTGTNIEFVGTILHKDSLLSKLTKNPAYESRVYRSIISWSERQDLWDKWSELYRNLDNPARVADSKAFYEANKDEMLRGTEVLWPEKEDYLAHMKDLEEIGMRAFMKEKQNDPQGSDELVFNKFHWYREEPDGLRLESNKQLVTWSELTAIAAMDPSTGQAKNKNKGDWTVITSGYKDLKGRVFVHHEWTKRASPSAYIEELFNLNDRFKYQQFAVETNLYRNLLLPNILDEKKRREAKTKQPIKVPFYDVEQTENKRERIYRLEPKVNHGYILFNRALGKEFMRMIEDFPKATHDDAPDCLEILWNLANNRYKPSGLSISAQLG